jgi:hypothetical protein
VFPSIVSPTAAMVTEALFVAALGLALGLALAWPAPMLLAPGLAGLATLAEDDAPGNVPVSLAE